MTTKTNLQDVLETIRITAGEMGCSLDQITPKVLKAAASEIDDQDVSRQLCESADDMDRPVGLSDVSLSLQQWGVR